MQENDKGSKGQSQAPSEQKNDLTTPAITLPKGGGAIRGIGEKFAANPVTGTGSLTVPIYTSPGRSRKYAKGKTRLHIFTRSPYRPWIKRGTLLPE